MPKKRFSAQQIVIGQQRHIQLPKNFYLLLSSSGASRRYCEVIWRKDLSVGIKFLKNELRSEVAVEKPEKVAL